MLRMIVSFVCGFAVASVLVGVLFVFVAEERAEEKLEYGRHLGALDEDKRLLGKIEAMLGNDKDPADGNNVMFEFKGISAVVVERNGVKTVRVYNFGP